MKLAVALAALLLAGCETFQVRPMHDTAIITRVFSTPEQTAAFCQRMLAATLPGCAVWSGSRGVIFLPYEFPSSLSGHEVEHVFSGHFHKPPSGGAR